MLSWSRINTYVLLIADPKVCKVVEHYVCVKRDPVIKAPGFFMGYEMAWLGDEAWKAGAAEIERSYKIERRRSRSR